MSAPPFDAISISLADLWPLDRPLGFEENPQHLFRRPIDADQHPDARALADHGGRQPRQVAEEGGRHHQGRRRHRRDRDRQGDDGGRGGRRGHGSARSSCRGGAGRAGQPADRRPARGGRGRERDEGYIGRRARARRKEGRAGSGACCRAQGGSEGCRRSGSEACGTPRRRWLPQRRPRPMAAAGGSSPRRWPSVSPGRAASTLPRSGGPARMAA